LRSLPPGRKGTQSQILIENITWLIFQQETPEQEIAEALNLAYSQGDYCHGSLVSDEIMVES